MKKLLCIFVVLITKIAFAQNKVLSEVERIKSQNLNRNSHSIFSISTSNTISSSKVFHQNNSATQLVLNEKVLKQIETEKSNFLSVEIPSYNFSSIVLELVPIEIFSPFYKIVNSQNTVINKKSGLYYQGIIKGDKHSLVAFCIIDGEVSGVISNSKGNFVLGKLKNSSQYIYYKETELSQKPSFKCSVTDDILNQVPQTQTEVITSNTACRPLNIYLEADNAIYTSLGSNIINTTNFISALFAQVTVIYNNENITIQLSQLKIWDTIDPYASLYRDVDMLDAVRAQLGYEFNGDIAHLISGRDLFYGIGIIDLPCNKPIGINTSISSSIQNVPIFSWNSYVIAHELGHNFGSQHTQSCLWPGGPIDNCALPEGNCSQGVPPVNGGTIMSYCHQTGYGINFSNGFGPLPGNQIRKNYQICFNSSIQVSELAAIDVYDTKAILSWKNISSGKYWVGYKPAGSDNWFVVSPTTNFVQLDNLLPNTKYDWGVQTSCTDIVFSTFTTNNLPPISYCVPNIPGGCYSSAIGIQDVVINNVNYNPQSGCAYNETYSLIVNKRINFIKGQTYSLKLNPLFIGGGMVQAAVWIDYNKNGSFEFNEKIFSTSAQTNSSIEGYFTIPIDN